MKNLPKIDIAPPRGRLGILIPGMGAVATTFIAGVFAVREGLAKPFGSLSEMGKIRLGKRTENRIPRIREFVPLAELDELCFAGWDIFDEDLYQAALHAGVLRKELLDKIRSKLEAIKPFKGVFDKSYVKKLNGDYIKTNGSKWDYAHMLMEDIQKFKEENTLERLVMIWCGSTEVFMAENDIHRELDAFEKALKESHPAITPSMIYAYAALKMGIPYANGAPNLAADIPAFYELMKQTKTPVAGKDFKTGQTLLKTILAPGLKSRLLGVSGWFSTNILGNRDGEVLDDPDSFKTKEESKLSVLNEIFQPDLYPELYRDFYHKVRINYYPPRGDNKESWDNIDIFGWLGYPMQIKVDFLCRDSILAAPIVLDLALFLDLAKRAGFSGIQEWLSFYFKKPMTLPGLYPEHDLFVQFLKLQNTLRFMKGEDQITHLGADYYEYYR